jgi:hypothetical protein
LYRGYLVLFVILSLFQCWQHVATLPSPSEPPF